MASAFNHDHSMNRDRAWWDDAYSNGKYIAGAETFAPRWAAEAAAFREEMLATGRARLDQPYGASPRERFDLFLPQGPARGAVVFVHGGYWLSFDKSGWSHLARGPLAQGWAVALPSYSLCPEVRIKHITRQIGAAVTAIAAAQPGPLRLTGHSAGGHLVARLACAHGPLPAAVRRRVAGIVPVSGLFDLRPLRYTSMNQTWKLDAKEARQESPALQLPLPDLKMTVWVGADERPEFVRQSQLLSLIWQKLSVGISCRLAPGQNHFTVIEPLADAHSPLVAALLA